MAGTYINPSNVHPPLGQYSHGVLVQGPGKILFISGQGGADEKQHLPSDLREQARQCWRNIIAILDAAGMTVNNLTKVTTYLTNLQEAKLVGEVRANFLGNACPASTIVPVAELAGAGWLIEIEAIAFME
jgi:enamine deaminase RidA (YjgF/YER057c/UK114 family)